MEKNLLLGIDVGTTGTKSILFREDGTILGRSYRGYGLRHPGPGRSEQAAEDWWQAICETVRELCAGEDRRRGVRAISLSLQGGTVVPVDADGRALRDAIVWNDSTAEAQAAAFEKEAAPDPYLYERTGWAREGALPAMHIRRMREQEPEIFAAARYFLTVPDYISLKMTGKAVCDYSDAGINQLADIRRRDYDDVILRFAGISRSQLPQLAASGEAIGHLTPEAAEELGLTTDCILVAGAHDQYAVALGAGALKSGDILIGSGTAWVVTALSDRPDFESGLAQSVPAVPGLWGSLTSLSSGGICLDWLRKELQAGEALSYEAIARECPNRTAAEDGLFFFPFSGFYGKNSSFSRGSFVGMDLAHDIYSLARAVMEGVAFQAAMMLEQFAAKPRPEGIILAGGAGKSALWAQLLADILGLPVRIPAVADLACVGAAVLAGTGSGLFESCEAGYRRLAVEEKVILPSGKSPLYRELLGSYQKKAALLAEVYAQ